MYLNCFSLQPQCLLLSFLVKRHWKEATIRAECQNFEIGSSAFISILLVGLCFPLFVFQGVFNLSTVTLSRLSCAGTLNSYTTLLVLHHNAKLLSSSIKCTRQWFFISVLWEVEKPSPILMLLVFNNQYILSI